MKAYRSFTRWIGSVRLVRPILAWLVPRIDTVLLRWGGRITPFPTMLLTTTGAATGQPHQAPLWFLAEPGSYIVLASNFGRREPDWSCNLRAEPSCRVALDGTEIAATAELVGDEQWDGYFERFAEFYPTYRDYVADRRAPMWRLVTGTER
ncbi:MAG: nitroreductase family deazaflavin-dependent oxidoreductase [Acidimicrobiia bacterium]|nr:nitroreductase family deazaflavin-dependent oxidoreductase [Acidimicrobiia bacterium]NNL71527.1 nitroreductase family deazaflavin-dependent oxidoreductase [Acidimicrobiia bacterium]